MIGRDDGPEMERFLDGSMSPEETREFARLLELDGELRSAVEAERMIRGSVQAGLEAIPPIPSGSRERIIRTAGSAPAPTLPAPARGFRMRPLLLTMLAGALAILLLTIGRSGREIPATPRAAAGTAGDTLRADTLRGVDTAPATPRASLPAAPAARPSGDETRRAASPRAGRAGSPIADSASLRGSAPPSDTLPSAASASRSDSARVPLTISPTRINRPKE